MTSMLDPQLFYFPITVDSWRLFRGISSMHLMLKNGEWKEVKEDERAFIGGMANVGATISKLHCRRNQATKIHCCDNLEKISTWWKHPNCKM